MSNVGPRTALAVLSALPAEDLARAIAAKDLAKLTGIPGIGKKTAERMVLELRDKLPAAAGTSAPTLPPMNPVEEDVLSALVNLGYQRAAVEIALAEAVKNGVGRGEQSASFDSLFRAALATLSK